MVRVLVMSLLGIARDQDEVGTHARRDAASVGEAECRGGGTGRGARAAVGDRPACASRWSSSCRLAPWAVPGLNASVPDTGAGGQPWAVNDFDPTVPQVEGMLAEAARARAAGAEVIIASLHCCTEY
jgi:hypothetical protein